MKAIALFTAGFFLTLHAPAQVSSLTTAGADTTAKAVTYQVGERGAHHKVWNKITATMNASGTVDLSTNVAYVELATGLHYSEGGVWREAKEEFQVVPGWAMAGKGQHKVSLAYNLNTAGPVAVQLPDGRTLRSQVLSLHYLDDTTGKSVRLAEIRDCAGLVLPPNQVIYQDAFAGLKADVRFTYTKSGIEQDVILRQQPPLPGDLGLNPATTRLAVLTEFIDPPAPVIKQVESEAGSVDEELEFGSMRIGRGRAFGQETNKVDRTLRQQTQVMKKWMQQDGRTFLLEQVRLPDVSAELDKLPKQAALSPKRSRTLVAGLDVPALRLSAASEKPMEIAQVWHEPSGFVMDYLQLNASLTNYTLRGDTTYYITGPLLLVGTNYVDGGAVVKYSNYAWEQGIYGAQLQIGSGSRIIFLSDAYRPAVFTAKDDDTVGETISGSTGTPSWFYGYAALVFLYADLAVDVHDIRAAHTFSGVLMMGGPSRPLVRNCQFTQVNTGLYGAVDATWQNLLIYDSFNAMASWPGRTVDVAQVTVDISPTAFSQGTFNVTNSLFVAVSLLVDTNNPTLLNSVNCATNASGTNVFQTVGVGTHYLATNSPYRDVGTANIDSVLLASLQQMTTYPPPESYADANTLDLGFHYPRTTDWDFDGLEDGWELHYFGNLSQNGGGDYDGDGVSNLTEFLQGRNPTVGAVPDSGGVVRLATFTPLK